MFVRKRLLPGTWLTLEKFRADPKAVLDANDVGALLSDPALRPWVAPIIQAQVDAGDAPAPDFAAILAALIPLILQLLPYFFPKGG